MIRRMLPPSVTAALTLSVLSAAGPGCHAQADAPPAALAPLDRPFLFTYGTWDKKAKIEGGVLSLSADGLTPKGGGGCNAALDLHTRADASPAITLRVGARNTLKTLKLMLSDSDGHSGTWRFPVPPPSERTVTLTPEDGAPLSRPNETGKGGPPDLSKINQWQVQGDWGGDGPVDVTVSALGVLAPTAAIRQARADKEARDAAAREQARKDRLAAREKYARPGPLSPEVRALYAAAPDILAIQFHTGIITPSRFGPYTAQAGDSRKDGDPPILIRDGQEAGWLIGRNRDTLVTKESFSGDPLLTAEADDPANFTVVSADDPAFAAGAAPVSVSRKSKADNLTQGAGGVCMSHTVYLRLPHALTPGKTYTVKMAYINAQKRTLTLAFDPSKVRSESVHVNQVGFRPDDPAKVAFLSLWTGPGGGYSFPPAAFRLIDDATQNVVYTGRTGPSWPADTPEQMQDTRNFNGTDVVPLDFSAFRTPGRYRVEVDGVGCSYPFEIGPKVWAKAFWVQMKGFYNQRSGVEVGPPYSEFKKPADFKPGVNECVPITQSRYSLNEGDSPDGMVKGDTKIPVPDAWGGYRDAGDWNPRRVNHMSTTTFWQLDLMQQFPDYFKSVKLGIPNDAPGPDLLKECQFELSLFRRLQKPGGGVPFEIETNGDPKDGELSWKQSMPAYVYAPDARSSYQYAGIAARMAQVMQGYGLPEAKDYHESALKAMAWAEADRTKRLADGSWARHAEEWEKARTLAAVCLLSLTREAKWDRVFQEKSELTREGVPPFRGDLARMDAAWTYARLPDGVGTPAVKARARRAVLAEADGALDYQTKNAWGIASDDPGKPLFLGFFSTPHGAVSLLRAYTLTHDPKYLAGAVRSAEFCVGANPSNLVYTTGLGANPIQHPLNLDARRTGQKPPIGLTTYGNVDLTRWGDQQWITWPLTWLFGSQLQPSAGDWPTTENYFDVYMMPGFTEFTVDTWGPSAYVWGYLAARK